MFDVPDGVFSKLEHLSAMNTHTEYLLTGELTPDGTAVFSMNEAVHTATSQPKYRD